LHLSAIKAYKLRKVEPLYVVVDLFRKAGAFLDDTVRKPVYNRMLQTLRVQYRTSAWNFQIKPIAFSDEQLSEIIDNMNDKQLQKIYLQKINDKEYLQRRITKNYEYFPKIFNRKARKIIRYAKSNAEDKRWCEFSMVTDRLNAPELVDYYERKKISYAEWTTIPHYLMNYENNVYACAQYVFANNRGDCSYITGFTIYCLRKSGYTAFEIRVRPNLSRYLCSTVIGIFLLLKPCKSLKLLPADGAQCQNS
jgi:hypothetical protein